MHPAAIAVAAATLGGIAIATQNPLAAALGRRTSPLGAAFAVHLGGAIVAGAVLLARGAGTGWGSASLGRLALVAGALGVIVVSTISFAIPRLGVAGAVAVMVAGQLAGSMVVDHFGLLGVGGRPFDAARAGGALLLLAGAWLVLR